MTITVATGIIAVEFTLRNCSGRVGAGHAPALEIYRDNSPKAEGCPYKKSGRLDRYII